jgi:hypothetical protein
VVRVVRARVRVRVRVRVWVRVRVRANLLVRILSSMPPCCSGVSFAGRNTDQSCLSSFGSCAPGRAC